MDEREYRQHYRDSHRGLVNTIAKRYYHKNHEKILKKAREHYQSNSDTIKERARKYHETHKEQKREYSIKYRTEHPEIVREIQRKKQLKRRMNDPVFRMRRNVSRVIYHLLKHRKNRQSVTDLLGYSMDRLRRHLEKKFQPGMNWGNYGQWHIDHVIPLCAFNIATPDDIDFKRAWALSNLQPLWRSDNIAKQGKLSAPFQPSLAIAI